MNESKLSLFFRALIIFLSALAGGLAAASITAASADDGISQDVTIKPATSLRLFTAKWCGPCQRLKVLLKDKQVQELIKLYEYKALDVDKKENEELMEKYGVRSVPTLVFLKDGKIIHKNVGLLTKQELLTLLRRYK